MTQIHVGLSRLFFHSLVEYHRVVNLTTIKTHLFGQVFCIILLAMPRIGSDENMAKWPLRFFKYYYSISFDCILRASAEIKSKKRIPYLQILETYPIYITHYAFIYVYTGWVADTKIKISEAYP
jgi:hypothetical protein